MCILAAGQTIRETKVQETDKKGEKEKAKQTESNRWLLIMASLPLDRFERRHFHFRVGRGNSIIRAVTVPSSEDTGGHDKTSTSEARQRALLGQWD